MSSRDRRGGRRRPPANVRGSGPTPIPRRDAQGGHPMGPDDPTRCAPLHRARRRARRVLYPERLNHHGEHLVCTLVCDAALATHSRLYAGTSCMTLMSTRTPWYSTRTVSSPNLARLPSPIHSTSPLATGAGESPMRTIAIFVTSYTLTYRAPNSACPGEQLAQSILYIFAATVLSVFEINKVTINGVVQEPRCEFSSGVLVYVFLLPPSDELWSDLFFLLLGVRSLSLANSSPGPTRPRRSFDRLSCPEYQEMPVRL